MQKELWKDIIGYEGLYQISNLGRVKSLEKKITHWNRFSYCVRTQKEMILKQVPEKDGYLIVSLHKNKKSKWSRVHRLVAEAFIPNPSNLPCVNHKDLNKQNNCVDNLEWVTDLENKYHAKINGHTRKGKPVGKYDAVGNLIKKYENMRDFAQKENLNYNIVRNWVAYKPKKNNYVLKFLDDNK